MSPRPSSDNGIRNGCPIPRAARGGGLTTPFSSPVVNSSMASCSEIEPLLVDLADERLDADQAHQVRTHMATCTACARLFEDIERTGRLLTATWSADACALDTLTPDRLIAEQAASATRSRMRRVLGTLSAAAAMLIAVFLGSFAVPERKSPNPDSVTTPQTQASVQPTIDIDELRRQIEQEGMASRLLAAADELLAVHGGKRYAIDDYRFIANNFAPTTAGQAARKRLTEHNEGAE